MSDYIGRKVRLIGSDWPDFQRGIEGVITCEDDYAFRDAAGVALGLRGEDGEFVPRPNDLYGYDYSTELVEEEQLTVDFSASSIQKLAEALDEYMVVDGKAVASAAGSFEAGCKVTSALSNILKPVKAWPNDDLPKVRVTVSVGETAKSLYLDLDGHSAKLAGQMAEKLVEMIYEGEL